MQSVEFIKNRSIERPQPLFSRKSVLRNQEMH
jgi:hypothetical protein